MSNKSGSRFWCAFVLCKESVQGQSVTSFLSFEAVNRFQAQQAIERMLPDNPKWVGADGLLRPYVVLALHQCRREETMDYAQGYMDRFRDAVGIAAHESNIEWKTYH